MAMRLSANMLQVGALKASPSYTGATKGYAELKAQVLPSKLLAVNYRRVLGLDVVRIFGELGTGLLHVGHRLLNAVLSDTPDGCQIDDDLKPGVS